MNARTGRWLKEELIFDLSMISCYKSQLGAANGQDLGGFGRVIRRFRALDGRLLTAALRHRSRFHQPWTRVHILMVTFEKCVLVDNIRPVRDFSVLLPRALNEGRQQHLPS